MSRYETKDSGKRAQYATGAQRDTNEGKGRYDLIPPEPMKRLAQLYERGAIKYDARNWEKGIPVSRCFDSAFRHLYQALAGDEDEDHLAAVLFNVMCVMAFRERIRAGVLNPAVDDLTVKATPPEEPGHGDGDGGRVTGDELVNLVFPRDR